MPSRPAEPRFANLSREPRLTERVVATVLEVIRSKQLAVGARLPSERELGEQFGVSRTVIREAVSVLAAKGVVDVRNGSGLRVSAVDPAVVSESMELYLRGGVLEFDKVHEVRWVLEVEIAGLAAVRATDGDVASLREIHARMESEAQDFEAAAHDDLEFHRTIARATHNELFLLLMDSIGRSLIDIRRQNLTSGAARSTLDEHMRILERIAAEDAVGARETMAMHLDAVAAVWRAEGRILGGAESTHVAGHSAASRSAAERPSFRAQAGEMAPGASMPRASDIDAL